MRYRAVPRIDVRANPVRGPGHHEAVRPSFSLLSPANPGRVPGSRGIPRSTDAGLADRRGTDAGPDSGDHEGRAERPSRGAPADGRPPRGLPGAIPPRILRGRAAATLARPRPGPASQTDHPR